MISMIIDSLLTVWVVLFTLLFSVTIKNLEMKIEMQKIDNDHLKYDLSIAKTRILILEVKQNGE